MHKLNDKNLQRKLADIRNTLQKLGTSFTEDETSEFAKSGYSSDDSFINKLKFYSPKAGKIEKEKEKKKANILSEKFFSKAREKEEKHKSRLEKNAKADNERQKCRERDMQIQGLKMINEKLTEQIDALHELVQQKEKELSKMLFEKELHIKAEEEHKRALEVSRIHESELTKELASLRYQQDLLESDKKDLLKTVSELKSQVNHMPRLNQYSEDIQFSPQVQRTNYENQKSPSLQFDPKKFDFQRLRIPERIVTSNSPDCFDLKFTDRESKSYQKMCCQAMKIVGVNSSEDLYPKLLHLKQYHSKYKKAKSLIGRISSMIVQCSPEGTFHEIPSKRQIWKWITRLLEEYMKIKQTTSGNLMYQLMDLLGTASADEIYEKVKDLAKSKQKF